MKLTLCSTYISSFAVEPYHQDNKLYAISYTQVIGFVFISDLLLCQFKVCVEKDQACEAD